MVSGDEHHAMNTDTHSSTRSAGRRAERGWRSIGRDVGLSLAALDPGLIALRRGLRGAVSFALTVLLARAVGALTGQDPLSMALGFSVSIFGAVVAREVETRARLISTCWLIAASGASFCVSALLRNPWINHALFVAVVFAVVYARRWGERANATGFGAFSSFFLAAFLAPSPAELSWHLLGLLLASLAVFAVQVVLLPQRPRASIERIQRVIARQIDAVHADLGRCVDRCDDRARRSLRLGLARLEASIRRARTQLDAIVGGSRGPAGVGLAWFQLETAAEALARRGAPAAEHAECRGAFVEAAITEVRDALRASSGVLEARLEDAGRASAPSPAAPRGAANAAAPLFCDPGVTLQTRLAIQASAACALAILAGEWLSPQRWYWAVITVFVMFTGTSSRGDAIDKSLQRLLGTVLGVLAGMALVRLVGNEPHALFLLLLGSIFFTYCAFTEHFATMTFFLTIMLALLFALLRRFSGQLLWLRLEETALGAIAGILVSALLLPRTTHSHARDQFMALLASVDHFVAAIVEQLLDHQTPALDAHSRDVVRAQDDMIAALRPLRLLPGDGGRRSYLDIRSQLRRCRASFRALIAAAAPRTSPLAPGTRRELERLQAAFRQKLSELGAWVRAERADGALEGISASGVDGNRLATPGLVDRDLEEVARALNELTRALSRVAGAIVDRGSRSARVKWLRSCRGTGGPARSRGSTMTR
jgi:uncharacterized membrane protein YccC